jgi:hypothetical protein
MASVHAGVGCADALVLLFGVSCVFWASCLAVVLLGACFVALDTHAMSTMGATSIARLTMFTMASHIPRRQSLSVRKVFPVNVPAPVAVADLFTFHATRTTTSNDTTTTTTNDHQDDRERDP